jgi:hypothetical protein
MPFSVFELQKLAESCFPSLSPRLLLICLIFHSSVVTMSQKYSLIKLSCLDPLVLTADRRMAHLAIQQSLDTIKTSTSPNQTVGLIVGRI